MRIASGMAAVLLAALLAVSFTGCSGEGRVSMGEDTSSTARATDATRRTTVPTDSFMGEDGDSMTLPTNIGDRDDGVING